MRKSQTLMLQMSEKRGELAAVTEKLNQATAAGTEPSQEDVGKADGLTREIRTLEVQYRAAVLTEEQEDREANAGAGDPETRELQALTGRARIGRYVAAALEMRGIDGAEAELNQALNITGGNRFPLALLASSPDLEHRTTTDTDAGPTRPRRWLDRLFAETAAMRLGITMESVEPGVASFPITTHGATVAQRGRREAAGDAPWQIGVSELKPTRAAVRAVFSVEDDARIGGLEDALQRDLRMALTEGIDRAIFLGAGGASEATANITGLTGIAGLQESTVTQANKVKPGETLAAFLALVDGIHAGGLADLNVVSSTAANVLWDGTIANAAAENQTVGQFLRASGLSWMARGELEASTAANKFGAFVGRGRGIAGAGVAALWSAGELIRDPYTKAAEGEVSLTLNYLWAFGLPRPASFARVKFVA